MLGTVSNTVTAHPSITEMFCNLLPIQYPGTGVTFFTRVSGAGKNTPTFGEDEFTQLNIYSRTADKPEWELNRIITGYDLAMNMTSNADDTIRNYILALGTGFLYETTEFRLLALTKRLLASDYIWDGSWMDFLFDMVDSPNPPYPAPEPPEKPKPPVIPEKEPGWIINRPHVPNLPKLLPCHHCGGKPKEWYQEYVNQNVRSKHTEVLLENTISGKNSRLVTNTSCFYVNKNIYTQTVIHPFAITESPNYTAFLPSVPGTRSMTGYYVGYISHILSGSPGVALNAQNVYIIFSTTTTASNLTGMLNHLMGTSITTAITSPTSNSPVFVGFAVNNNSGSGYTYAIPYRLGMGVNLNNQPIFAFDFRTYNSLGNLLGSFRWVSGSSRETGHIGTHFHANAHSRAAFRGISTGWEINSNMELTVRITPTMQVMHTTGQYDIHYNLLFFVVVVHSGDNTNWTTGVRYDSRTSTQTLMPSSSYPPVYPVTMPPIRLQHENSSYYAGIIITQTGGAPAPKISYGFLNKVNLKNVMYNPSITSYTITPSSGRRGTNVTLQWNATGYERWDLYYNGVFWAGGVGGWGMTETRVHTNIQVDTSFRLRVSGGAKADERTLDFRLAPEITTFTATPNHTIRGLPVTLNWGGSSHTTWSLTSTTNGIQTTLVNRSSNTSIMSHHLPNGVTDDTTFRLQFFNQAGVMSVERTVDVTTYYLTLGDKNPPSLNATHYMLLHVRCSECGAKTHGMDMNNLTQEPAFAAALQNEYEMWNYTQRTLSENKWTNHRGQDDLGAKHSKYIDHTGKEVEKNV